MLLQGGLSFGLNLLANAWLAPRIGVVGLALSTSLVCLVMFFALCGFVSSSLRAPSPSQVRSCLVPLLPPLLVIIAAHLGWAPTGLAPAVLVVVSGLAWSLWWLQPHRNT